MASTAGEKMNQPPERILGVSTLSFTRDVLPQVHRRPRALQAGAHHPAVAVAGILQPPP